MNPLSSLWARIRADTPTHKAAATAGTVQLLPDSLSQQAPPITFQRMIQDGYRAHATVFACVQMHATMFTEPELHVWAKEGKDRVLLPDHECRRILAEPNPDMDEVEFWEYVITYAAIGGLAGLWKERARDGRVLALWPLHRAQIKPLPAPGGWLRGWEYNDGSVHADKVIIPKEDVIPIRWAVDPLNPLDGLSPIVACARAVDQGNEAMRYVYSLLKNDAVARTAIVAKNILPDAVRERMKSSFADKFGSGGTERGGVVVVEGQEAEIKRLGANLQELAAEALHNVPDAWIAMAYGTPAVLVGTPGGLQRAIQGAPKELTEYWTETNRAPRWAKIGGIMTRHLLRREFGGLPDQLCAFDLSQVAAMRDDEVAQRKSASEAYLAGILTRSEARSLLGLESGPGDDGYATDAGGSGPALLPVPPAPPLLLPAPSEDDEALAAKAAAKAPPAKWQRRNEQAKGRLIDGHLAALARELSRTQVEVARQLEEGGRVPTPEQAAAMLDGHTVADPVGAIWRAAATEATKTINDLAGGAMVFNWESAAGKRIAGQIADRIKGIDETTRDRVREYVRRGNDEGLSVGGLAKLIREDSSAAFDASRALTIARTESAVSYNLTSVASYAEAGIDKVVVFDGDEDGPCADANGKTWTLEQAEANPVSHPNCVRAFAPAEV